MPSGREYLRVWAFSPKNRAQSVRKMAGPKAFHRRSHRYPAVRAFWRRVKTRWFGHTGSGTRNLFHSVTIPGLALPAATAPRCTSTPHYSAWRPYRHRRHIERCAATPFWRLGDPPQPHSAARTHRCPQRRCPKALSGSATGPRRGTLEVCQVRFFNIRYCNPKRSDVGPYMKQSIGQGYCALRSRALMPDAVVEHEMTGALFGENTLARVEIETFCAVRLGFATQTGLVMAVTMTSWARGRDIRADLFRELQE